MSKADTTLTDDDRPAHALAMDQVLAGLATQKSGLSSDEARRRLTTRGANRLPEPPRRHPVLRFMAHFHNVLIYVLIGAAAITAGLGHFIDTGVILAVVIANAVIGFVQEGRAETAMDAIRHMLAPHSSVLRDGRRSSVDSAGLVPGDVVILEAGEKVPADIRLIEARGLRIDEAILTGESVPAEKQLAPVALPAPLGDRTCMAYSGTMVSAGSGLGAVVATGRETEIGRISGMLARVEQLTTPLIRQMDAFARWLTVLILLIAGILLVYGYFVGHMGFPEVFMSVVGLSVAAIPEGLPAVLTITLAVGVQAMARRNAIVRRLPAIETLGSVSVICTDKTGTLTRNEMLVAAVAAAGNVYTVTGEGYAPEGALRLASAETDVDLAAHPVLFEMARAAALCNDAALLSGEDGWRAEGDPMEGALKALAGKITGEGAAPFADWVRLDTIPFDAAHRYMAVLHRSPDGFSEIHVKGAPEQVLAMTTSQRGPGGVSEPLDASFWYGQIEAIAAKGQRVLALAVSNRPAEDGTLSAEELGRDLVLLGLVGLIDPPRPEAVAAIVECQRAGIRVKMITGDHAGTAAAIAGRIGLTNPERVMTGTELDAVDEAELAAIVVDTDVFARTSPEHKLRLVSALQSHGLTVAMTGDGVNDAPALKRADAGIAMGRKGSDAARETADLVLADDNFASIVAAVREGRTVYDNIKKVISWTLPTSGGEAATIIVALFLGLSMPITPVQILWVNLITGITLGLALAFEPTEANTMKRAPRPRGEPLLGAGLIWHVVVVSLLFLGAIFGIHTYALDKGHSDELARTLALNTLVVLEIFHLFFIRNIYGTSLTLKAVRGTPVVWLCVVAITAAQFAITYFPPLQEVFGTRSVPLADGALVVAIGVVFLALVETEKQLRLAVRRGRAEA
ncbi:HAD-IC family P-type ATPase [Stappia sp. MMSF_3263]|uniref:HAD-IC family P-type ATPase n=1 Tax=Stappia sp. MMSF_3263 TaxID=3046693 RepID=UPI00273FC4F4|nr:HAD-IC family P-type ATPase [Stappia sp. MMSF_3263]